MELKSVLRFAGLVLSPACACLIITAGCTTESELPLPPGAYVAPPEKPIPPENSALSTEPEATPAGETVAFPTDSEEQSFTLEDLAAEDVPVEPESVKKEEPAKAAASELGKDDIIYAIRKNDTLGGIARRHGMSAATLANYNGLTLKSKIYAGKTLRIPATVKTTSSVTKTSAAPADGSVYVVKSGDTLGGIAQKHGVRTADLAAANNLDVRKPILVGQKLIIPAGAGKQAAAAASSSAATKPAASTKKAAAPAAKSSSKTTTSKTTAAKTTASTTTAAASSSTAAKESAPAGKTEPAPEASTAAGQNSADDLLKNIGSESDTASSEAAAPAASANTGSVSVAPAAGEEVFDADNTIEINIEREMTLEETARAFDRSYATVKKLNPDIQPDVRLKAGTAVKIPIF